MTATAPAEYVSLHDQRVRLMAQAMMRNSDLAEDAAIALAEHGLYALDHIPEKMR
jgi:hypothetical protein